MIEGNGFDTAEAGPSGWPLKGQKSNGELRRRYPEHQSVPEGSTSRWQLKVRVLLQTSWIVQPEDGSDLSRTLSTSRTPPRPTHYLATPPPEDHELQSSPAWPSLTNPSLAPPIEYFHTPMVDDEDEFERLNLPSRPGMPPLTRQTTYSSLPPSPRYEDYDFAGKVNIKEFEEALGRLGKGGLRRSSVSASAVPRSFSVNDMTTGDKSSNMEEKVEEDHGLSMWDLLKDEVGVENFDGWIVDGKWERIANFLAVPLAVEKVRPLFTQTSHSSVGLRD
jgi:hypothetical protein